MVYWLAVSIFIFKSNKAMKIQKTERVLEFYSTLTDKYMKDGLRMVRNTVKGVKFFWTNPFTKVTGRIINGRAEASGHYLMAQYMKANFRTA
jgi:hypothetical protein